ncbi:hypothetical protein MPSEU_000898700 [Mayamaea pseudoterrestris]|nr:hypothetical protein MPSEU_000898700 [Mayamaea pseudoterrestris]
MTLMPICLIAFALIATAQLVTAFAPPCISNTRLKASQHQQYESRVTALFASSSPPTVIVVSPPGGIGEVAAVKSASMGCKVRWFVVSSPTTEDASMQQQGGTSLQLSPQAMRNFQVGGGTLELAGSDADKLLLPVDNPESTISALSQWTGSVDALICTYDTGLKVSPQTSNKEREIQKQQTWDDAIKVAAREAAQAVAPSGSKVAILSAFDEEAGGESPAVQPNGRISGVMTGILNGGKPNIPTTLTEALNTNLQSTLYRLRHGALFGLPESSPDFSPLVGGPKKDAELCEEYTMRAVRVDPSLSIYGNVMLGSTTRSSRIAVGEAAVLMALLRVPVESDMDVCISSQRGMEYVSIGQWKEEFMRAQQVLSSGQGARLFTAEFASVPNVSRLADWLATKWAPAVLRTYDIATIRSGERPVNVRRVDENKVEIVWQQLVDFQSATVGTLIIEVNDTYLTAIRGSGDASKGFGAISSRPLNGEDVIVRFLAEAASQAVEKGLAKRAIPKKLTPKPQLQSADLIPVTTLQSSGTVTQKEPSLFPSPPSTRSDQGPRTAGARRSTERQRGKQRRKKDDDTVS